MNAQSMARSLIEPEQREFVTLLHDLTPEQWTLPSCCESWSVHAVVLHAAIHTHRGLREVLKGSDQRMMLHHDDPPAALIELLASPISTRLAWDTRLQLDELMIHQQDVRRPLGIARVIPADRLSVVLSSVLTRWVGALAGTGARKRANGLHLIATDIGWSAGTGPEVHGPGETLLMALAGRSVDTTELQGDAVATLTERTSVNSK
jgi:uncharacterized protein (TIGR03083 family)